MKRIQFIKSLVVVFLIAFLPFGIMIWFRIHQSSGFAALELITYPLIFGGGSILLTIILKKFFLKESLTDFNSVKGNWTKDILLGILLSLIYFAHFYLCRAFLTDILAFHPNEELLSLMLEMRRSWFLILIWFGPVLWIGVAFYEEIVRVFILDSMWKWNNRILWQIGVIIFAAVLFGLVHWSQGPFGIVSIFLKSIISGFFYLRYRRLMPLVYAHVLYDGLQVAAFLFTYPG